jgi:cell division septum initiation protein DivIVA
VKEHQRQQQRLARLKEEVAKKDGVVEQLALQLQQVQATLQRVIDDTSAKLARPLVPTGVSSFIIIIIVVLSCSV